MSPDVIEKQIVISSPPAGVTSQPSDESAYWTPNDGIAPPEDLERLASLTTVSRLRRSCIEAVVQNTVGLGWRIVPREGVEEEVTDDDLTTVVAQLDALARRDTQLRKPSFKRLLEAAKWDEQEVGNGFIEVSRNRVTGQIDGLFHVPGKRMRRRKDRQGWIMGPKNGRVADITRFYDFGTKVKYDDQGRPTGTLVDSGRRWDVNEVIVFQLYTSESRDYGLPCDVQLALDYLGDKLAAQSNVGFFDASGVPPTVLTVGIDLNSLPEDMRQGPVKLELDQSTIRMIQDTLSPQAGRQRRVAIVPLPSGANLQATDLGVMSDRDMGFVDYRRDNRRAVLGAWRISPIFVADIEDTNYSTAETERKLTKEQKFDPEQERWTDILNESLLRELGPAISIDFDEIAISDEQVERESANAAADRGLMTRGEYRRAHRLDPLPEAAEGQEPKPGEVPFGWNSELVEADAGTPAGANPELQSGIEAAARLVSQVTPTPEPSANGTG